MKSVQIQSYSWSQAYVQKHKLFRTNSFVLAHSSSSAKKFYTERGIPGPHFTVFSPNTGKYGQQKPPYLVTFHAVSINSIPKRRKRFLPFNV